MSAQAHNQHVEIAPIHLVAKSNEPRVDSREIAEQLGVKHKNTLELVERYTDKFSRFGLLPFKTEAVKKHGGRGAKHYKYALLNEDQSYFLLSLSRNTDRVVELKANLVMAFREARDNQAVTDTEYLPLYHSLHEEVKALSETAKLSGSTTPEHFFHINVNKAINNALGIQSGQRHNLSVEQRLLLITLNHVFRRHLHAALNDECDHKEAFRQGKSAVLEYVKAASPLMIDQSGTERCASHSLGIDRVAHTSTVAARPMGG